MKNIRFLILSFIFFVLLSSCGVIRDGFSLQKKDNTDEFLVKKKNPLKLPPNFEELPVPKSDKDSGDNQKDQEIKSLLTSSENNSDVSDENVENSDQNIDKDLAETSESEVKIEKSAKPQIEIN